MIKQSLFAALISSGLFLSFAPARAADAPAAAPGAAPAAAAGGDVTDNGVIKGTMTIDFGTRTNLDTSGKLKEGSPALGAKDKYSADLLVNNLIKFAGDITRQPTLFSKILGRPQQEAKFYYSLQVAVANPKNPAQTKTVGKWVGSVPFSQATGIYDIAGGLKEESPLRFDIDSVGNIKAFKDPFTGQLAGKAEKKETLAAKTYKRLVGGKEVSVTVKRSDPMNFQGVKLAKGPSDNYPATLVNGRLDYDYETGNYFTDGIRLTYTLDGKEMSDVITGSIRWIEDPQRKTNGKGHYDFNLRFNEDANKKGGNESAAFEKMSEEDAFFAVDTTIPTLTGTIEYQDTFIAGNAEDPVPSASKVTYSLNANKLSKQQIMAFAKLWLVAIGPTNDE